ncbi:hypothetical protein FWC31_03885 [Candidatus Saccharibacteria bacterium]|nr:hypothetical protein [Candidatus Saccharibacteria bacterium]
MNKVGVGTNKESGQVSILTVIIFILLFSVLVISFSRVMVMASRQTVNDELAASAKAAAEAGIEDAKRILSYCVSGGLGCGMLDKPIEESTCTEISGTSSLMHALQRTASGSSVKVGDGGNNEEYLCLKMTMMTPDYLGSLDSNGSAEGRSTSVIIPLRFSSADGTSVPAKTIRLQWHSTSRDDEGSAELLAGNNLPPINQWGKMTPAVLRAEFVAVPIGTFTIDNLVENTRAVTLRPSTTEDAFGAGKISDAYNLDSWIAKNQPNAATDSKMFLMQVRCQSGVSSDGYACSISFTIPKVPGSGGTNYLFDTDRYDYYLRLQAIYRNAHFRLSAKDASGNDLYLNNVQAAVDVTGRAGESLKRLGARLNPDNSSDEGQWWPDYAVDSAGKICKNMTILDKAGADNCRD